MAKKIIFFLSVLFVFLSFYPTLYEIQQAKYLPKDRAFELVHNYVFDYNFYLSRIREGQPARNASRSEAGEEGHWLVTEKYYNQPHTPSLFQIVYLYLGKLGGLGGLGPPQIYHGARIILGFILLLVIGKLVMHIFPSAWSIVAYLLIVTAGSWPILVKLGDTYRFSTHWGGWSVIDSLQRITFIPHVLLGQIFLVFFVWKFSDKSLKLPKLFMLWNLGLVAGIIFPPVLITIYAIFVVLSVIEVITDKSLKLLKSFMMGRIGFIVFTLPALLYTQIMFKVEPWKALAVFDIQHRSILPYAEYALALGPMLPLGLLGLLVALFKKEKRFFPFISWVLALGLLFFFFEHVPQQSPTRFTQMLINIPLGILATYLFYWLWQIGGRFRRLVKGITIIIIITVILLGLSVMFSMVGWKTNEVKWKREATWLYPVGVQLVYPLADFMDGVTYLKNNTKTTDVVLAYEAAGNYIPAYGGNFVYLGHANTPDEDMKLKIAKEFFSGEMTVDEAKAFLTKENIKYIYFGPQERELANINDLSVDYKFLNSIFRNNRVIIYRVGE